MQIVIDKKIPEEAKKSLLANGELIELETEGICYEAISGHPDIFFSQVCDQLIVAPNLPDSIKIQLQEKDIYYQEGDLPVGRKYPESAKYNVAATKKYLIHNFRYTDSNITDAAEEQNLIHVDQGYTRCNLVALKHNKFITSDKGIEKILRRYDLDVFYVNPAGIQLPGHENGFIGGCIGMLDNQLFIIGNLANYTWSNDFKNQINKWGYEIVELYDGSLFDGGSILFI